MSDLTMTVPSTSLSVDVLSDLTRDMEMLKAKVNASSSTDRVCIVCFSGEWDRLFAAFTIAIGGQALGMETHMFFTFWGASALKKEGALPKRKKTVKERLISWFTPRSARDLPLSKMNYGGLGKLFMNDMLKDKGIDDLPTLIKEARELGVEFHCCDTSMDLFGLTCDDIENGKETNWCGVSSFLSLALKGRITLFI